jgi:hypothetical protein
MDTENNLKISSLDYIKTVYGNEAYTLASSYYDTKGITVFDDINRVIYNINSDNMLWNYLAIRYNMGSPKQLFIKN